MAQKLEFAYDVVSIPCYLAWTQIYSLVEETGADLKLIPVLCGAIFKIIGNQGPLAIEAKKNWLMQDYMRWAERYGIPFESNPHAPVYTVPAMRGAIVAEERGETDIYVRALMEDIWTKAGDPSDEGKLRQVLDSAGLDSDAYISGIGRDKIKLQLRENTEIVINRGAFGVPTFFVGGDMYFGQDRLDFVREALMEC